MPNERENPCNRRLFEAAIKIFEVLAPDNLYALDHTYLDYGACMAWETIICYRDGKQSNSYQMLCPRDWDKLNAMTLPDDIFDLTQLVISIFKDQRKLLERTVLKLGSNMIEIPINKEDE